MKIKVLKDEIKKYLSKHQLVKKFQKAKEIFEQDIHHPSLNTEILEPKHLKIYSFRLDKKYRAIFIMAEDEAEIITVTNHYKLI
jgi:Txe/YoeB family toxin of Txe-Axe toxin-antitoxin module